MSHVRRDEIVDYITWTERKPAELPAVLEAKRARRVHVGPYLTLLFENALTIRYQVQEMMRVEQIVREADIVHELGTYNELLGGPGEVGCTLLVEVQDPAERAVRLREWLGLQSAIYALIEGGERVFATFDPRQVGEDRLSSVQYLKFDTRGRVPVAIGVDHPAMREEAGLSEAQRTALREDLSDS